MFIFSDYKRYMFIVENLGNINKFKGDNKDYPL